MEASGKRHRLKTRCISMKEEGLREAKSKGGGGDKGERSPQERGSRGVVLQTLGLISVKR